MAKMWINPSYYPTLDRWLKERGHGEARKGFEVDQEQFEGFVEQSYKSHSTYSQEMHDAWAAYTCWTMGKPPKPEARAEFKPSAEQLPVVHQFKLLREMVEGAQKDVLDLLKPINLNLVSILNRLPEKKDWLKPSGELKEGVPVPLIRVPGKKERIALWGWRALLLAALLFLLFGKASGQGVPHSPLVIDLEDATVSQAIRAGGLIRLNCGANLTCVWDTANNRFTMDAGAGGSVAWDGITAPGGNQALAMGAWNTTHTFGGTGKWITSFDSAFTTGTQFLIRQQTGDPSGGTLFGITVNDSDVLPFAISDGTNVIFTIGRDGTITWGSALDTFLSRAGADLLDTPGEFQFGAGDWRFKDTTTRAQFGRSTTASVVFDGADNWLTIEEWGLRTRDASSNTLFEVQTDADTTIRNWADQALVLALDSGSAAAQQTSIVFRDRGTDKWKIRYLASASRWEVLDLADVNRLAFNNTSSNTYKSGSATDGHAFLNSGGTTRVTIHGDSDKISWGASADVSLERTSDPNTVLGLAITAGSVFGLPVVAGDPNTATWGTGQDGRAWFNSTSNLWRGWDGSAVQTIGPGGAGDGVGYDEVLEEASGLTKRAQINFIGVDVTAVDNGGATRTDVTIIPVAEAYDASGWNADTGAASKDDVRDKIESLGFSDLGGSATAGQVPNLENLNGTLDIGSGGTGQTTANPAFNALSPVTTEGDLIYRNATVNARLARGANGECLTSSTTTILWGSCGAGGNVDLLDGSVHQDTTAGTVLRGDLIVGQTATPEWTRLGLGGANTFLGSDATDATWTSLVLASAQFVNQGTTTTVLHGNAAGNPSFGAVVAADTTGTFPPDTEALAFADLSDIASTSGSGTVGILGTNPTLTDVTINDLITFTETAGDDTCGAGDYWLKGNSTSNTMRGCEDGNLFDVNTSAGSAAWDTLTAPSGAVTMDSDANAELVQFNYTSDLGATDVAFQIEQLTGNPVTGSILLELTASDADILLLSAGGATIDQAGAISAPSLASTGSGVGQVVLSDLDASNTVTIESQDVVATNLTVEMPNAVGTTGHPLVATVSGAVMTLNTAVLGIVGGGTGQATASLAFDALSPVTTEGDIIMRNATVNVRLARGSDGECLKSNTTTVLWGTCAGGSSTWEGLSDTPGSFTTLAFYVTNSGASALVVSSLTEDADSIDSTKGFEAPSYTGTGSNGVIEFPDSAASTAGADVGRLRYDQASQNLQLSENTAAYAAITQTQSFGTGNCAEFDANGDIVDSGAGCGGGAGDNVSVNSTAVADIDLDDADPAAPANGFNVKWQLNEAATPDSVSAYFDTTTYASTIVGSGSTIVETWNVGASDPVWTVATGVMNLSTGTLQQGGNAVELQSNKDAVSGYAGLDGSSNLALSAIPDGTANQILGTDSAGTAAEHKSLASDETGTDFGITHTANTVTFNWPIASTTNTGKLSNTDWDTFDASIDSIAGGDGVAVTGGEAASVAIDLLTSQDGTGVAFSFSGMEFGGSGSDEVALLQGCDDDDILKWDDESGGNGRWDCATDVSGGSPLWNDLGDPTAAMSMTSSSITELMTWDFQANYTTELLFDVRTTTGTPSGGVLANFQVHDADVTILRAWDGTDGVQVSGAGALGIVGSGTITATDLATDALDALTEIAAGLCAASQILERQGSVWACIATPAGGSVDLLDGSVHQDTAAGTATQGDIITVPASGDWTRLPIGGANDIFGSDGTDAAWEAATGTSSPVRANNPLFPVQVRFTAMSAPSYAAGNLFYDSTDQALSFHNDESDVTLQVGQEGWIRVRNVTGSTINNGQVVYIIGIDSGLPSIALARADAMATAQAIGIATHSIEDTTNGYVTAYGLVRDFDTSAFTVADRLYLSASTAGLMTNTAPSDPNFVVPIAIVTEDNASTGDVLVTLAPPRPTGGAGIQVLGNSISTLSSEENFLVSGALSCGANTRGKLQTHTTPLQYCDNDAPPALQYAAYAASDGDALAGDSATSFFDTGTLELAVIPDGTANQILGTDAAGTAAEHKSLATGTAGTDFAIVHTAGVVTFNIPVASGTNTGKLSNTDWTTFDDSVDSVGGGNGITSSGGQTPSIAVDLLTADDQVGSSSNQSGLEFGDTGSDKLALLRGCNNGQVIKFNTTGGLWECQDDDDSGGSPAWEALVNTADTPTSFTADNTAETFTLTNSSAFSSGSQILFNQTGAPTAGGVFFEVRTADVDGRLLFNFAFDDSGFIEVQAGSASDQNKGISFLDRFGDRRWEFFSDDANGFVIREFGGSTRFLYAEGVDAADGGEIRFGNNETLEWEQSTPGADLGFGLNGSDIFIMDAPLSVTTGYQIGGAAATDDCLLGNATNFVASTNCVLVGDSPNAAGDISGTYTAGLTIDAGSVASAELATANKTFDKSFAIIDPTTAEDDKVQWMHGKAVTYTDVDCSTDAGTVTIDMDHRVLTTPNTVGTDILTGTIVCDSDNQADGGFADATIPANVPVNLSITGVSGAGTVRIHIRGTVDP